MPQRYYDYHGGQMNPSVWHEVIDGSIVTFEKKALLFTQERSRFKLDRTVAVRESHADPDTGKGWVILTKSDQSDTAFYAFEKADRLLAQIKAYLS